MLSILQRMCCDTIEKNELSKNLSIIFPGIRDLLELSQLNIIKHAALNFLRMFLKTNDMRCWLKMSSSFLPIDASNHMQDIFIIGSPRYFGDRAGLYDKWGAFFDEGDALYMKDRIRFDDHSQVRSFTISLWFVYPFSCSFKDLVVRSREPDTSKMATSR